MLTPDEPRPDEETWQDGLYELSAESRAAIRLFVHGAVCSWVVNRRGQPFGVRELVGWPKDGWTDTPLRVLLDPTQDRSDFHEAFTLQPILREVLRADPRAFDSSLTRLFGGYRWQETLYLWVDTSAAVDVEGK